MNEVGPNIEQEIERMIAFVASARELLEKGHTLDLSSLDGEISALCENAKAAPPEERNALAEKMEALIKGLDLLEQEIKSHKDRSQKQDSASAANAYDKKDTPK
jgi:hypothetical protein